MYECTFSCSLRRGVVRIWCRLWCRNWLLHDFQYGPAITSFVGFLVLVDMSRPWIELQEVKFLRLSVSFVDWFAVPLLGSCCATASSGSSSLSSKCRTTLTLIILLWWSEVVRARKPMLWGHVLILAASSRVAWRGFPL